MSGREFLPKKDVGLENALASLSRGIGLPVLRSSTRQAILMSLAINSKMKFTDLMRMTGSGKGSLWNHIDQMAQAGLVRRSKVSFFTSPRMFVEITARGLEVYEELLGVIRDIAISSSILYISSGNDSTDNIGDTSGVERAK